MERTFAKYFHEQVKEIIGDEADREQLFESLRVYQSTNDLQRLVTELRHLLNEPHKLELYEHIRPLILPKHQIEYSRKSPQMPGVKLRVIRLKRQPGESIGFAVRGGFEHGVGVFVSRVESGSQAEKRGLKVGDEIVRVNGFTIAEAIHDDVLNLIKSREEIVLKVTHIGMLPFKDQPTDNVAWKYVQMLDSSKVLQEVLEDPDKKPTKENEIKIFINTAGTSSIGCGIVSGPRHFPGIFVENVRPQSLAEEVGLEVGDQIIEVNGTSFDNISHKEAVVNLKGSKQLHMVIKKKTGLPLFQQGRKSQAPGVPKTDPKPAPGPNKTVISVPREDNDGDFEKDSWRENNRESWRENNRESWKEKNRESWKEKNRESWKENNRESWKESDVIKHMDGHRMNISADVEPTVFRSTPPPSPTVEPDFPPPPPPLVDTAEEGITSFSVNKSHDTELEGITHFSKPEESVMTFESEDVKTSTKQETQTSDIYRKQPGVLGGRGAILAARQAGLAKGGPTLLGAADVQTHANMDSTDDPYALFPQDQVEGKKLCIVELITDSVKPLGLQVEGGIGTPLVDKILVADLYGVAHDSDQIEKGDQLMMVNGRSLIGVTEAQARNILQEAEDTPGQAVKIIFAKSGLLNDEDAITYF
ncbi:harmonin-like [Gigantopelta aegis]|uniref:harmonin-like n=1 Tax=Gigantopelta aegis TaxID=1735272 RepID=UPI001B88833C|nr:harmonin-like [Gigantopelta aegis]